MDFIEDKDDEGRIKVALSVAEYLEYVNLLLGHTRKAEVIGEISSVKPHPTGVYMTIKDPIAEAVLDCYISPYTFKALHLPPLEAGMLIRVSGVASVFMRRGSFRLQISDLSLVGEGTSKQSYDSLKKKLDTEGIFTRKREIPKNISKIVLITSRTGAVIHDFQKNLRAFGIHVSVIDVRVEGKSAPSQIIRALQLVNSKAADFEVCVIIRGGGSLEDLQAFNTEDVVRAVFGCRIPVMAGIGHETDVPLVSLAADFSASTPTAVAVAVNQTWADTMLIPSRLMASIIKRFQDSLEKSKSSWQGTLRAIIAKEADMYDEFRMRAEQRLGWIRELSEQKQAMLSRMNVAWATIAAGDPKRVLERGYSITRNSQGQVVRDIRELEAGQVVTTLLKSGSFNSLIQKINPINNEEE